METKPKPKPKNQPPQQNPSGFDAVPYCGPDRPTPWLGAHFLEFQFGVLLLAIIGLVIAKLFDSF